MGWTQVPVSQWKAPAPNRFNQANAADYTQVSGSAGTTPDPGWGNQISATPKVAPPPASFQPDNSNSGGSLPPGISSTPGGAPWDFSFAADPNSQFSPGSGGGGSSDPYGNNTPSDPGYQQALAQQQMGFSQLDSALKAARERAIINFGDPAMADMAGFGLDSQAGDFARQNYLSGNAGLARLDKQHALARKAVIDKLAGHGILDSGDLGYQTGQEDQQYGNKVYDSRQQLLAYLADLYQQSLDRRQSLRDSLTGAYNTSYQNMLSNY